MKCIMKIKLKNETSKELIKFAAILCKSESMKTSKIHTNENNVMNKVVNLKNVLLIMNYLVIIMTGH